jgi:hypothetical protein
MSTEAPSLAAALAAVQRKLPDVRKAETAHVRSDKGSYSYRYATLPDITKAVLPLLGENGLAWMTRPTLVDDRFVLVYELLHTSGEKVSGEYPLPTGGSPQALGSAITYARRYCLCAVTGVAADDDDDGAAATAQHHNRETGVRRRTTRRRSRSGRGTSRPASPLSAKPKAPSRPRRRPKRWTSWRSGSRRWRSKG